MTATFLVQYGRPGYVGRFAGISTEVIDRSASVVVRTPRGVELGTLLCTPDRSETTSLSATDGEFLRATSPEDAHSIAEHDRMGAELLSAAQSRGDAIGLPLAFVDVEILIDGSTAILHILPWSACDATPLLDELGAQFGLAVRLLDLSRAVVAKEPVASGCGKEGCGKSGGCSTCSTGGGCSTGSCSKGKVKSAEELTSYFSNLRQQMQAQTTRMPLV